MGFFFKKIKHIAVYFLLLLLFFLSIFLSVSLFFLFLVKIETENIFERLNEEQEQVKFSPAHLPTYRESCTTTAHSTYKSFNSGRVDCIAQKKNFPLSISSVNVTKSAENCNTAYFNTALKASDQKEPELFFPSNWKIKLSY